ncbi:hypothetical protein B620_gp25 [Croceibacter phage P2559S]|uniref:hypothetical protein n=1 Tax=Croceibacter phage P2559S TaxID=1176422 RepID=UPI0002688EB4|nr:hypothetical protein B620_gp25 [Croceibacter phage P2559S]AFM54803.1 hypothetical protein P2559S_25 [Croceibacter phage P2559S]
MAWENLITAIEAVITDNDNNEITGTVLRDLLINNLVPQLGASKFMGVANTGTVPAAPQSDVFYIAKTSGTYNNFDGVVLDNEAAFIAYQGGNWVKYNISDSVGSFTKLNPDGNLYEKGNYESGYLITSPGATQGNKVDGTPSWHRTGAIPALPNTEYTAYGYNSNFSAFAYSALPFNNANCLGTIAVTPAVGGGDKFTTPAGTNFLGFNVNGSGSTVTPAAGFDSNFVLIKGDTNVGYVPYGRILSPDADVKFPINVRIQDLIGQVSSIQISQTAKDELKYNPLLEITQRNAFTDTYGNVEVNSAQVTSNKPVSNIVTNTLKRVSGGAIPVPVGFEADLQLSADPGDIYAPVINYKITPAMLQEIGIDVLSPTYDNANPKKVSFRAGWLKDFTGGVTAIQIFTVLLYGNDPLNYSSFELNGSNGVISTTGNFYGNIVNDAGNASKDFNASSVTNEDLSGYRVRSYNEIPVYKEVTLGSNTKTFTGILISILPQSVDVAQLSRKITSFGFAMVNSDTLFGGAADTQFTLATNAINTNENFVPQPFKVSQAQDVDTTALQNGNVLAWDAGAEKFTPRESEGGVSTVTFQNSEKIAFYGCSFTESYYAIKNKSWVNKLAQMTDYIVANFGVSGNRLVDESQRLLDNSNPYHGSIGIKELNATYISFANIGNETLHTGSNNLDLYKAQMIEAIQAVYSVGATPIMGTDHNIQNTAIDALLYDVAKQFDTLYYGIGTLGERIVNNGILAFWGGGHPATRTNAHQFLEWLYFISQLPRPKRAIKVFRVRTEYKAGAPALADLNYDDINQRVKFWQEINSGEKSLKEANGQNGWEYYDRLNEAFAADTITNEYCKLINKENVQFNKFGLFEFILDKVNPTALKIYIKTASNDLDFYIKDNNNPADYKDNLRNQAAFEVTKAIYDGFNEPVDTAFTSDAHGANEMTYKGKEYSEALGGYWLFFKLSSGTATAGGAGNLSKVAGGGNTAYLQSSFALGRHSYDFFSTVGEPQMRFVPVAATYENGHAVISLNPADAKYLEFDKVKLIVADAGTFSVSDAYIEVTGGVDKPVFQKDVQPKLNGTELNADTAFRTDWISANNWVNEGATLEQMPVGLRDYPTVNNELRHVKLDFGVDMFPQKIKKVFNYPFSRGYTKVTIKAVVRLFPKVFNTTVASDDYHTGIRQITADSYDMGTLCVGITTGAGTPAVLRRNVDIGWAEVTFETYLPPFDSSFELSLWRDEKDLVDANYRNHTFPMQLQDVSVQIN